MDERSGLNLHWGGAVVLTPMCTGFMALFFRLNLHWGGAVVLTSTYLNGDHNTVQSQSPLGWSGGADSEEIQPGTDACLRLNLHWGGAVVLT